MIKNKDYTDIVIIFLFLRLISGDVFHSRKILLLSWFACEKENLCESKSVRPGGPDLLSPLYDTSNLFLTYLAKMLSL